jgi:hypothetical protein
MEACSPLPVGRGIGNVFLLYSSCIQKTLSFFLSNEKKIESTHMDWWFVRKHLTDESGWAPAKYLRDEASYSHYVDLKIREKIEKLPILMSKSC